jgi:hypothetical protein
MEAAVEEEEEGQAAEGRAPEAPALVADALQVAIPIGTCHSSLVCVFVHACRRCLVSVVVVHCATERFNLQRLSNVDVRMQELEKAALAESTGLDAKQINNWFINQRKRHWKPAPPPILATTDYRLHHNSGGASSSSTVHHAALRAEWQYFAGGSAYPRGP